MHDDDESHFWKCCSRVDMVIRNSETFSKQSCFLEDFVAVEGLTGNRYKIPCN